MKTSELIGPALDWAVEVAKGSSKASMDYWMEKYEDEDRRYLCESSSTNWSQGGPIIEREKITVIGYEDQWEAYINVGLYVDNYQGDWDNVGHTPLIAAMRCYCCAKLGDEVEIPEELK